MSEMDVTSSGRAPERDDVQAVADMLVEADSAWRSGETRLFGEVSWQPELERSNPPAVLHVHLAGRLRSYILERLRMVRLAGYEVHLAMPLTSLYDEDLLTALVGVEPYIHIIGPAEIAEVQKPLSLLACLTAHRVRVTPDTRAHIGNVGLELSRKDGGTYERGQRFEGLLAFLFSQVEDFHVVERNYRTETEELDAVIQQRATGGRAWANLGAPFILVEAKNWKNKVDQKEFSAFRVKMQGKRGTVRLGLMVGASGFTGDAMTQELKFASDDLTIAFLGPEELEGWIGAPEGDDYLETIVRRAMMR